MICETQSRRHETSPLMKTDTSNYPFEKLSIDISGPYGEKPRENLYTVSVVDCLTNWPEAYVVFGMDEYNACEHLPVLGTRLCKCGAVYRNLRHRKFGES